MKKVLLFGIIFIFVIIVSTSISSAANIGISAGSVSGYAGETVKVTFKTTGVSQSNQLGALEAQIGSLPNGITVSNISSTLGSVQNNIVSWFAQTTSGYSSNVTITVTLKISDSVKTGKYNIPMSFNTLMDFDGEGEGKTVNATVTINEKSEENENTSGGNNSENNNPTKSSDASLKSITAQSSNGSLNVTKNSTKYTTTVDADVNKVTFTVTANSSKATIDSNASTSGVVLSLNSSTSGKKVYTVSNLKEGGTSVVRIAIIAEDGTKKDYSFVVTRKVAETSNEGQIPNVIDNDNPEESDTKEEELGLKSLVITGVEISPAFNTNVYEYTGVIGESDSVEVIAIATVEDATIEITGNENLKVGENVITVLVTSADGKETKTYQIIVTKAEQEEQQAEEADLTEYNKITEEATRRNALQRYILMGTIAIITILIIVYLVGVYRKGKNTGAIDYTEEKISKNAKPDKGKRFK